MSRERTLQKNTKDVLVKLVSEAVQSRLKNDYSPASKFSLKILNTEGWKNSDIDNKFGVEAIISLYKHFQIPLEWAGFNRTLSVAKSVQLHCHVLIARKNWISSCLAQGFSIKLKWLLESCFVVSGILIFNCQYIWYWQLKIRIPLTTKVRQMFFLMKRIKTDGRSSLSEKFWVPWFEFAWKGQSQNFFHPIPLMTLWNDAVKCWRWNQAWNCTYKKQQNNKASNNA